MALPNSIHYSDISDSLKIDVHSTTIVINPVNSKSSYSPGYIIYLIITVGLLIQRAYL